MEKRENEQPVKRDYKDLRPDEKVFVILGGVLEPVSKAKAIKFSGIDYESLDKEQKEKVDSVFSREGVEATEETGEIKYRLSNKARERLSKTIDMDSVNRKIVEDPLRDLGIDFSE